MYVVGVLCLQHRHLARDTMRSKHRVRQADRQALLNPRRQADREGEISADWKYDLTIATELEVRFIADSDERTRVELEHRKPERYGDKAEMMRGSPLWISSISSPRLCF